MKLSMVQLVPVRYTVHYTFTHAKMWVGGLCTTKTMMLISRSGKFTCQCLELTCTMTSTLLTMSFDTQQAIQTPCCWQQQRRRQRWWWWSVFQHSHCSRHRERCRANRVCRIVFEPVTETSDSWRSAKSSSEQHYPLLFFSFFSFY